MGMPRRGLLPFCFDFIQDFRFGIVVQDGYFNQLYESFIFVFPAEGRQDGLMRDGLVELLIVRFPEPCIFRIPSEHHPEPLHTMVQSFSWNACEGIVYQAPVDIISNHAHDGMMKDSPRKVALFVNDTVLSGIVMHFHLPVIRWREVQIQYHPLKLIQVLAGMEVMAADVPVLFHLPGLCLPVSCFQVLHGGNLFQDMAFSFYHTIQSYSDLFTAIPVLASEWLPGLFENEPTNAACRWNQGIPGAFPHDVF